MKEFDVWRSLKCDDFMQQTFKNYPTKEFRILRLWESFLISSI